MTVYKQFALGAGVVAAIIPTIRAKTLRPFEMPVVSEITIFSIVLLVAATIGWTIYFVSKCAYKFKYCFDTRSFRTLIGAEQQIKRANKIMRREQERQRRIDDDSAVEANIARIVNSEVGALSNISVIENYAHDSTTPPPSYAELMRLEGNIDFLLEASTTESITIPGSRVGISNEIFVEQEMEFFDTRGDTSPDAFSDTIYEARSYLHTNDTSI